MGKVGPEILIQESTIHTERDLFFLKHHPPNPHCFSQDLSSIYYFSLEMASLHSNQIKVHFFSVKEEEMQFGT